MWKDYFGGIYLVNLAERKDRLNESMRELGNLGIDPVVVPAIKKEVGNEGLLLTMQRLFAETVKHDKPVLVFEDDVNIVVPPLKFHQVMDSCINMLKVNGWRLFHLGPNTHQQFGDLIAGCLLRMNHCYSTHAVAYSVQAQKGIIESSWKGKAIDVMLSEYDQVIYNCYCSYPLLATQRNGFSDIDNKEVSYDYIVERFEKHTSHLR